MWGRIQKLSGSVWREMYDADHHHPQVPSGSTIAG